MSNYAYSDLTFLAPHGPVAAAQRGYFIDILLILLVVVLPVFLLTPLIVWRYRYGNPAATYRPNWSFSWLLEILAWVVPTGVVVMMGIWLWRGTHALNPYAPLPPTLKPLPVQIVGYDWKWLFIYPTLGIASVGEFPFPANQPLSISLTSDTVMQSFFIPSLGSQIYAMAGMVTHLHLQSDVTGSFLGENTQYNGMGFNRQHFTAVAMTAGEFQDWVDRVRNTGVRFTADVYEKLSHRSDAMEFRQSLHANQMPQDAAFFRGIQPQLFSNIVASFHGGSQNPAALIAGTAAAPPAARFAAGAHPAASKPD